MKNLIEITGLTSETGMYKALRQNQVKRSERFVSKATEVMENDFLNPFSVNLDNNKVYNISSGSDFQGDADELLGVWNKGKQLCDTFHKERIYSSNTPLHATIKRQKVTLFDDSNKPKPKSCKTTDVIKANRNILGTLIALSAKFQQPINFEEALKFPLYPIPLSLGFPDGTKRSSNKSKLLEVLGIKQMQPNLANDQRKVATLIIDMIAQYRVISTNLPVTFEEWITKFLKSIPKGFERIDIVADCYREYSIKSAERSKRGTSAKILINSVKCKVPRDSNKFFSNNENKSRLISLTFSFIKENNLKSLQMLKCNTVILSGDCYCEMVTTEGCFPFNPLKSDQEEADTKVVLHAIHALGETTGNICIRSPSGDTDIFVIALAKIAEKN